MEDQSQASQKGATSKDAARDTQTAASSSLKTPSDKRQDETERRDYPRQKETASASSTEGRKAVPTEDISLQLLEAYESEDARFVSLRTPSYRRRSYLRIQAKLFAEARARGYRVLCLLPTSLETEAARNRLIRHYREQEDSDDPETPLPGLLSCEALVNEPGEMAFMTYRSFVRYMLKPDNRTTSPPLVVLAHECPQPTVDSELALCVLATWPSEHAYLLVGVWRLEEQVSDRPGWTFTTDTDQIVKAIREVVQAKELVLSFLAPRDSEQYAAAAHSGGVGTLQQLLNPDTNVGELTEALGQQRAFDLGALITVDPLGFGEGIDLGPLGDLSDSGPLRNMPPMKDLARVGLVILDTECDVPIRHPQSALVMSCARKLTRNQLAIQSGYVPNGAACLAAFPQEELKQLSPAPERVAFNAEVMSSALELVALWPDVAPGKMPIRRLPLVGNVEWACDRLAFLGLVERWREGYATTDIGRRLLDVSAHMQKRRDFNTLHLIARAAEIEETPKVQRLLVRMALASSGQTLPLTDAADNLEVALEVPDFEYQAPGPVKLSPYMWDPSVGSFQFREAGPLWLQFCCWDKLRRASRNFSLIDKADSASYPLLTLPAEAGYLKLFVAGALETWGEVADVEGPGLLDIPADGSEEQETSREEASKVELHLMWAYSDCLFRIVRLDGGQFEARTLASAYLVTVDYGPVVNLLNHHWDTVHWDPTLNPDKRCLVALGVVEMGDDDRPTIISLTRLFNNGHIGQVYNSSEQSHRFLSARMVAEVTGTDPRRS